MKKRIAAMLLAVIMLMSVLAACGGNTAAPAPGNAQSSGEAAAPAPRMRIDYLITLLRVRTSRSNRSTNSTLWSPDQMKS